MARWAADLLRARPRDCPGLLLVSISDVSR
jgi:hypothetical protein